MQKLTRILTIIIALGLGTISPRAADAENCWMVGCVGIIGYIYLPIRNTYPGDVISGCEESPQFSPFGRTGLPDVNSVVAIDLGGTEIYAAGVVEREIRNFPMVLVKTEDGKCKAELSSSRPTLHGATMRPGSRVKILGYRTFHGEPEWWADLPFALVVVVED